MQQDNDILTTAEKLIASRVKNKEQKEKVIENMEEFKKALNGVAASPNGNYVLKIFIKALGVFAVKPNCDGMSLVKDKALREFYLSFIRPYLDDEIRQDLER